MINLHREPDGTYSAPILVLDRSTRSGLIYPYLTVQRALEKWNSLEPQIGQWGVPVKYGNVELARATHRVVQMEIRQFGLFRLDQYLWARIALLKSPLGDLMGDLLSLDDSRISLFPAGIGQVRNGFVHDYEILTPYLEWDREDQS